MSEIIQEKNKITSIVENKKEKSTLEQISLPDGRLLIQHTHLNKETGEEIIKKWYLG